MGSLENQIKAAKKYKAPKDYKPLTTAQKVGMAASATPLGVGRAAAAKVVQAAATKAGTGVVRATMGKATSKVYKAAKTKEFAKRNETVALVKNSKKAVPLTTPKAGVKLVKPTNSLSRGTRNLSTQVYLSDLKTGRLAKEVAREREALNKTKPKLPTKKFK